MPSRDDKLDDDEVYKSLLSVENWEINGNHRQNLLQHQTSQHNQSKYPEATSCF